MLKKNAYLRFFFFFHTTNYTKQTKQKQKYINDSNGWNAAVPNSQIKFEKRLFNLSKPLIDVTNYIII